MLDFKSISALVIAPHPDDEIFGCGGFIHRIKESGGKVYVMYITAGTTMDFSPRGKTTAQERLNEIEEVANYLKFDDYTVALPGDEYHLKLDAIPQKELIHTIERGSKLSLESLKPDIVLTPSNVDYNQDHRAVSNATISAVRPVSPDYKSFQPLILTYELPYHQWNVAESLNTPGFYVKLSDKNLKAKLSSVELYKSQIKAPESPLSVHGVKTLAHYRGLQCGVLAAEAFGIIRLVI
jgi:LmbE family N-acetylglucosaminyl deacetylase